MILAKTVGGPKEDLLNSSVYKDGVILSSLCGSFAFPFQALYNSYNLFLNTVYDLVERIKKVIIEITKLNYR